MLFNTSEIAISGLLTTDPLVFAPKWQNTDCQSALESRRQIEKLMSRKQVAEAQAFARRLPRIKLSGLRLDLACSKGDCFEVTQRGGPTSPSNS